MEYAWHMFVRGLNLTRHLSSGNCLRDGTVPAFLRRLQACHEFLGKKKFKKALNGSFCGSRFSFLLAWLPVASGELGTYENCSYINGLTADGFIAAQSAKLRVLQVLF